MRSLLAELRALARTRVARALLWMLLPGVGAGCGDLLEVDTPSRIPAEELENPANAALLVNSAVADFECAFGAYVVIGGLIGEELVDATQTADRYPYDSRNITPADRRYSVFGCVELGVYTPLSTARASADNVLASLEGWTDQQVPNRTALIATAATHAGYSLTLMGEGFCSAALSRFRPDGGIDYGPEIARAEVFTQAVERFTRALAAAQAAGDAAMLNTALVGRARAYLNLGRYAEARTDAARVPAGFVRNVTASAASSRRQNRVWAQNNPTAFLTSVGEPYRALNDPRVVVTDGRRTSVTGVPFWVQGKYAAASTPMPLATAEEARLIVAEAEARSGSLPAALAILNAFRTAGGQPAFNGTTQAEVLAEVLDQRRRELFLESHHLGDMIRFSVALRPAAGATFHGGGRYGSSTCMPLPNVEKLNNPNVPD